MLRPIDYTSGFPKPFLFDYMPLVEAPPSPMAFALSLSRILMQRHAFLHLGEDAVPLKRGQKQGWHLRFAADCKKHFVKNAPTIDQEKFYPYL